MEDWENQPGQTPKFLPAVRVGWPEFLNVYGITDAELKELAEAPCDSVYLNLAIFLLSIAGSFFASLLTVSSSISDRVFTVFVVIVVVGTTVGVVLAVVAVKTLRKNRRNIKNLVEEIRSRIPPEGVQEIDTAIVDQVD